MFKRITVSEFEQALLFRDGRFVRLLDPGVHWIRGEAVLVDVGVKDLILPGDLKEQFLRVIEARKKSEAAQIERREEVAATRSLANTAQLLEKNPTLLKLKILESLEKIAAAGAKIILPADFLAEKKDG